jgi:hypothetical protein
MMNDATFRKALRRDHLAQPVLGYIQLGLIFMGSVFWAMAWNREEAFSADIYGEFALMFRAEAWALAMMCPAAMIWVGLRHPLKRWMVAVGSMLQLIQFMALGYSAIHTGGEPIIGMFCNGFFAPLFAYMLVEAIRDA